MFVAIIFSFFRIGSSFFNGIVAKLIKEEKYNSITKYKICFQLKERAVMLEVRKGARKAPNAKKVCKILSAAGVPSP